MIKGKNLVALMCFLRGAGSAQLTCALEIVEGK